MADSDETIEISDFAKQYIQKVQQETEQKIRDTLDKDATVQGIDRQQYAVNLEKMCWVRDAE